MPTRCFCPPRVPPDSGLSCRPIRPTRAKALPCCGFLARKTGEFRGSATLSLQFAREQIEMPEDHAVRRRTAAAIVERSQIDAINDDAALLGVRAG